MKKKGIIFFASVSIFMILVILLAYYSRFKTTSLNTKVLKFLSEDTADFSICNLTCFRRTEMFYQGKNDRNIGFYLLKEDNVLEKYESYTSKICLDYIQGYKNSASSYHLGVLTLDRFHNGFCFARRNINSSISVLWIEAGLEYNFFLFFAKLVGG